MEKDIEDIFKKIQAEEAGIRTFDDLAESFDSTYLKGLSKADATKFASWFLENGYDNNMGARPMQRLIQDTIKPVLAEEILFGKLSKAGGTAYVTLEEGKIKVSLTENSKKTEKV